MRITKRQLKRLIKEEVSRLLHESSNIPAGAHSEYDILNYRGMSEDAASVTVYDDTGKVVDDYTISLHPNYGTPEYELSPQPTDMSEFVRWARSHNLFNLPAYDHTLPGLRSFEDIIMILDEQDEYGKAYSFPQGTPGAW
ncbi:MAG: hypothetical protein CME70_19255 [Halobacteriovorax sp.]|nr:hypothetical protein [Halobacteriovorax sp.]